MTTHRAPTEGEQNTLPLTYGNEKTPSTAAPPLFSRGGLANENPVLNQEEHCSHSFYRGASSHERARKTNKQNTTALDDGKSAKKKGKKINDNDKEGGRSRA
jgi:hypothetical protein